LHNRISRLFLILLAALLLASCSAEQAANEQPADEQPAGELANGSDATNAAPKADDTADTSAGIRPAGEEPVAAIPERGIYLYTGDPEGAILRIGESEQAMDWVTFTPRAIMPVLQLHDYDRDGEDELAVVLHVGSGTGLAIEELHIVELTNADASAEQPFIDHLFREEHYLSQLEEALAFQTVDQDGELFGQVTVDGRTEQVSLTKFQQDFGADNIRSELGFGAIVYFKAEADELTLSAAIGLRIDDVAEPQYFGNIEASVSYASGTFELSDFRFTAE